MACLSADIREDTVFVNRVQRVAPDAADSMGVSATASIDQCGPPEWDGTAAARCAPPDNRPTREELERCGN